MTGKWHLKGCPVCEEGTLHDGVRRQTVDYRGEKFKSEQPGAYCDKCADGVIYHDPAIEQAWADFREQVNSRQAEELREIRCRLRLSQDAASKLTGGGHNAFSRYECGKAQPMMAVLNLMRLLDREPARVRELLPEYTLPYSVREVPAIVGFAGVAEAASNAVHDYTQGGAWVALTSLTTYQASVEEILKLCAGRGPIFYHVSAPAPKRSAPRVSEMKIKSLELKQA